MRKDSTYREPYIDWAKWRPLLGKISDCELAKQIGCSRSAVIFKRKQLGIPAFPSPHRVATRLSRRQIKLLGTKSDRLLAEEWGLSEITVRRNRVKRGIPAAHPDRDNRERIYRYRASPDLPDEIAKRIVAAARRASTLGLSKNQVCYIFGPLLIPA